MNQLRTPRRSQIFHS